MHDKKAPGYDENPTLSELTLGKTVSYSEQYDPSLLQQVPRTLSRDQIGLTGAMPFTGVDVWNGYELSFLNGRGKPVVLILQCSVPFDSPNLIESKSFKLYLNSFNQHTLPSVEALQSLLEKDLSACAGATVGVVLFRPAEFADMQIGSLEGENIDELDVEISEFDLHPEYLQCYQEFAEETLNSDLLKSNCLITNQPDWASVQIRYKGKRIDREGLLKYLVSFRLHNEFHEQCVERIFCDLMHYCQPEKLSVYARYTRRGGLDINPFRSNFETLPKQIRLARQ